MENDNRTDGSVKVKLLQFIFIGPLAAISNLATNCNLED